MKLLCRLFGHSWRSIATNGFQMDIDRCCYSCKRREHRVLNMDDPGCEDRWIEGPHPTSVENGRH